MARKAVVVGAGPVGCLAALALAQRGWQVAVYEGRPDLRLPSSKAAAQSRSINLAVSHRGIAALTAIDPAVAIKCLAAAIPMRGRMIHSRDGTQSSQLYDKDGQCINSVDRAVLNEDLLKEAVSSENICVFFDHKVVSVDFDRSTLMVQNNITHESLKCHFDFCIGADGSYSVIRTQLMRVVRMDYSQEYIRHEYIELKMPCGRDSKGEPVFLLDPGHLHIWPRHSFMLIALPNKDKTFTCTLFASSSEFDCLGTANAVITWFREHFPDALALIGEKNLIDDFRRNPRSPLICTKCKPYHYLDRAILLGDAAHSMVPFYGQGLNCGLEDVRVLSALLDEEDVHADNYPADNMDPQLARALRRYSESRHDDLVAICELAMDNYVEMRHKVTTITYRVKKLLDNLFYALSSSPPNSQTALASVVPHTTYSLNEPRGWLPLYTMVTFRPDIRYSVARRKAIRQSRILGAICWIGGALLTSVVVLPSRCYFRSRIKAC